MTSCYFPFSTFPSLVLLFSMTSALVLHLLMECIHVDLCPSMLFGHLPHPFTIPSNYSYVVGLWVWMATSAGYAAPSHWHSSDCWHLWMDLCTDGPHGSLLAPCCRKLVLANFPVREEIMNHLLKSKHLSLNVPAFTAVLAFSPGIDYLRGEKEKDSIYSINIG